MHKVKNKEEAKIRNPYNQIPHLIQDTICESDKNTRKHNIQESQEVSSFLGGVHKAATCQHSSNHSFLMDAALLSISPASHGQLVKMLLTLAPHGIFGSNCILICLNIVQQLVCKFVTRLLGEFKTQVTFLWQKFKKYFW